MIVLTRTEGVIDEMVLVNKKSLSERWKIGVRNARNNWVLYLFILPVLSYIILFCYVPMYGIQIAFRDYTFAKGITDSPWVGLRWFESFILSPDFFVLLRNTLAITLYSLVVGFPAPIIFALIVNYLPSERFKKVTQTITYMPHFISVVVFVNMFTAFLSPVNGFINTIIKSLFGKAIYFIGDPSLYRHIYVWTGIWQGLGWGAIIYVAALSSVSSELHEAAIIDGATKIKRMWHIDLPAIAPTIVTTLILRCGSLLSIGFAKSYLMQNALNNDVSKVISTYVYSVGIKESKFGLATAVGLMQNVVNFIILTSVNKFSKMVSESSLW